LNVSVQPLAPSESPWSLATPVPVPVTSMVLPSALPTASVVDIYIPLCCISWKSKVKLLRLTSGCPYLLHLVSTQRLIRLQHQLPPGPLMGDGDDMPQAPYPSIDQSRPTLSDAYWSSYAECQHNDSSHTQSRQHCTLHSYHSNARRSRSVPLIRVFTLISYDTHLSLIIFEIIPHPIVRATLLTQGENST
jgi:hypothetical protein